MRIKCVRGYTVPHSISKEKLSLIEDTFTIIMHGHKEVSVVIRTISLAKSEKM